MAGLVSQIVEEAHQEALFTADKFYLHASSRWHKATGGDDLGEAYMQASWELLRQKVAWLEPVRSWEAVRSYVDRFTECRVGHQLPGDDLPLREWVMFKGIGIAADRAIESAPAIRDAQPNFDKNVAAHLENQDFHESRKLLVWAFWITHFFLAFGVYEETRDSEEWSEWSWLIVAALPGAGELAAFTIASLPWKALAALNCVVGLASMRRKTAR